MEIEVSALTDIEDKTPTDIAGIMPTDSDKRITLQLLDMCIRINDYSRSRKLADMQIEAVQGIAEGFAKLKESKKFEIDSSEINESFEYTVCNMLELCFDPRKDIMNMNLGYARSLITAPLESRGVQKPQDSKRKRR